MGSQPVEVIKIRMEAKTYTFTLLEIYDCSVSWKLKEHIYCLHVWCLPPAHHFPQEKMREDKTHSTRVLGDEVMLEYLRLYRRIFVLLWAFARFTTCRIQINNGIRIFLPPSAQHRSRQQETPFHLIPKIPAKSLWTSSLKIHSERNACRESVVVIESERRAGLDVFLKERSHVHSIRSLKPAECHEECKQRRNHHMIVATQI